MKHLRSSNPISRREKKLVTRSEEEALSILSKIREQLRPDNFEQMARRHSDCSTFEEGGDLGEFTFEMMHKPFSQAAFGLRVGEMTDKHVDTVSGYHHILRLS